MKVPSAMWAKTVAFYRDGLGLRESNSSTTSVVFEFGSNRLWIDCVESMDQAEIWLEVVTDQFANDEQRLMSAGAIRCDDVEPLPEGFEGFWIRNPAGLVQLVTSTE